MEKEKKEKVRERERERESEGRVSTLTGRPTDKSTNLCKICRCATHTNESSFISQRTLRRACFHFSLPSPRRPLLAYLQLSRGEFAAGTTLNEHMRNAFRRVYGRDGPIVPMLDSFQFSRQDLFTILQLVIKIGHMDA